MNFNLIIAPFFAHGLAVEIEDVPLPLAVFYWGSIAALVFSFALLALGGRSLNLGEGAGSITRRIPGRKLWSVLAGALALPWLVLTVSTGLWGNDTGIWNPSPILVFVTAWLGAPLAALLIGRAALRFHVVLVLARLFGMREKVGNGAPAGLGVWVAWAGLLLFVWLELVHPTATNTGLLAILVLAWLLVSLAACALVGTRDAIERIDPFGTYLRMLASLSILGTRRDGRFGLRLPLLSSNRDIHGEPGLVALVTLLIGSVSYDGLTRTSWWAQRVSLATGDLAQNGIAPDISRLIFGTFGLVMMLLIAWIAFELAAWLAARTGHLRVGPGSARSAQQFAPSLLPIAFAYVIAHYFSFFVVQSQELVKLASDPFLQGFDFFGTAERTTNDLWVPSGTLVWLVQVGSIVLGHVAGLLLAHDRAISLAPLDSQQNPDTWMAIRSQTPMLFLMLLYTVGGLYFLSEGLS